MKQMTSLVINRIVNLLNWDEKMFSLWKIIIPCNKDVHIKFFVQTNDGIIKS